MWDNAIKAIQENNINWIKENRLDFQQFFKQQNLKPQGKLSRQALEKHYQTKLFKMFLAKNHNGLALNLDKGAKWIENASFLDGNWGWLLGIGVGGAYFADYCTEEIAQKYFTPKEALVAGSGKPCNQATPAARGYVISGSWKYCSGSEQASIFTAVTIQEGKPKALIIPTHLANIKRDWNAIGLPLTCSHSFEVKEVLIPENHFFDLSKTPRGNDYSFSSYPFLSFAMACFSPVITGITKSLLEDISLFVRQKQVAWKTYQPKRYGLISLKIEEMDTHIKSFSSQFYHQLNKSWKNHLQQQPTLDDDVINTGQRLADYCYEESFKLIPLLGMLAIENNTNIQKQFTDLQTAYQHMVFRKYS